MPYMTPDYFAEATKLPMTALLAQWKEIEHGLRCGRCGTPLPKAYGLCPRRAKHPYLPNIKDRSV